MGFWSFAGLPEPHGYEWMGVLFLGVLFLLQNGLFAPYLKVLEERESETVVKKRKAEKTFEEANLMIAQYRRAIEETRLAAIREREQRALMAEEEERRSVTSAKQRASEEMKKSGVRLAAEEERTRKELRVSVPSLAEEITSRVMAAGRARSNYRRASAAPASDRG